METHKKFRLPRKIKKKVPKGMYCYTWLKKPTKNRNIKICIFYEKNQKGIFYCKYITKKHNLDPELEEYDDLFDDMCKICSINNSFRK